MRNCQNPDVMIDDNSLSIYISTGKSKQNMVMCVLIQLKRGVKAK